MASKRWMRWFDVPDGSTLELSVEGTNSNFQITGSRTMDDDPSVPMSHRDVVPSMSPLALEVRPDPGRTIYGMVLNVTFLGADSTTVTFKAAVRQDDGTVFGKVRTYTASGTTTDLVTLSIFMDD